MDASVLPPRVDGRHKVKSILNFYPINGALCGEHYINLNDRDIGEIRQTRSGFQSFFFSGVELKSKEWRFVANAICKFEELLAKETKKDEEGYSKRIKYYSKEIK